MSGLKLKEKMHVYIITKEGRVYTDEGLELLKETLAKCGCTDPTFVMGGTINDPKALAGALKENSEGIHIVLSHTSGIIGIRQEDHDDLYNNLINGLGETSYETIVKMFGFEE